VGRGTIHRRVNGGEAGAGDAKINAKRKEAAAEPAAKLVIEVDGQIHNHTVDRDTARDDYIRGLGLRILRVAASEVMEDTKSVADGLVRLCGPSTTQLR
jgi:very-short-patch-repair endonuclease